MSVSGATPVRSWLANSFLVQEAVFRPLIFVLDHSTGLTSWSFGDLVLDILLDDALVGYPLRCECIATQRGAHGHGTHCPLFGYPPEVVVIDREVEN